MYIYIYIHYIYIYINTNIYIYIYIYILEVYNMYMCMYILETVAHMPARRPPTA